MVRDFWSLILLLISLRISIVDIKTHFINNLDLILLLCAAFQVFQISALYGFANFLIYLTIYFLVQKQLGFGDVKLSLIIGLTFSSFSAILMAINLSWFFGGCWAILSGQRKVAFAPWLLIGGMLAQIMVN